MAEDKALEVIHDAEVLPARAPVALTKQKIEDGYRELARTLMFDGAQWKQFYGRCLAVSAVGIYGHKDAETVAIAALKGFAMGLDFVRALGTVKVIHGTPTIRGPGALALIRERCPGATLRCVESDAEKCFWEIGRPGDKPTPFSYTYEQAEAAGLPGRNDVWKCYPKRMVKWAAFSEGAQELFGDVLAGASISEEIEGAMEPDDSPPPAPSAPEPPPQAAPQAAAPASVQAPAPHQGLPEDHPKLRALRSMLDRYGELVGGTDEEQADNAREKYKLLARSILGPGWEGPPKARPNDEEAGAMMESLEHDIVLLQRRKK